MKRVFGKVEAVFDILYLLTALVMGCLLLWGGPAHPVRSLCGIMALVLAGGDAFHLIPRVRLILGGDEEALRPALGRGKQITSITMTVFYMLLWQVGLILYYPAGLGRLTSLVYMLSMLRILLCFLPHNRWPQPYPPLNFGIARNVPFLLLGLLVAGLFFVQRNALPGFRWMWLAILLSFAFYLPVVLFVHRNPKLGMLMLPKVCAYVWMLAMFFSL